MRSLEWRHKSVSPCKDCPDRTLGCHSNCEKYIAFQQNLAEEKALAYERRRKESEYWKMKMQSIHRAKEVKKDYSRFK